MEARKLLPNDLSQFLVPKLPTPKEEDLSQSILETIDMDSYRAEKKAAMTIQLPDVSGGVGKRIGVVRL